MSLGKTNAYNWYDRVPELFPPALQSMYLYYNIDPLASIVIADSLSSLIWLPNEMPNTKKNLRKFVALDPVLG